LVQNLRECRRNRLIKMRNHNYFHTPLFVKRVARFIKYKNERKKVFREFAIIRKQNQAIKAEYTASINCLFVFIVPGSEWETGKDKISGGVISIVSLCGETAQLQHLHNAQTIMCTMREAHLFLKHTMFENTTNVYRFSQLPGFFTEIAEIVIHIPEYLTENFTEKIVSKDKQWLRNMKRVHINIMNQNIELMPGRDVINKVKKIVPNLEVTITTAHQKYCTEYYRNFYGLPIHKLSVWISPEQYYNKPWNKKDDLLVVSPDEHPLKQEIIEKLKSIPGLSVKIIQGLTYEKYKLLISNAKWALTFGEGLDGYFIEPIFSGAIGFAVYNESFFTEDFKCLKTVYASMEQLRESIVNDIQTMNSETIFTSYQKQQFAACALHYSKWVYKENIASFYRGEYTYA
jgi:hypothetical protein